MLQTPRGLSALESRILNRKATELEPYESTALHHNGGNEPVLHALETVV